MEVVQAGLAGPGQNGRVPWSLRTLEAGALAGCCLWWWLMVVVLGWWLASAARPASAAGGIRRYLVTLSNSVYLVLAIKYYSCVSTT